MIASPGAIAFEMGPITVRWYGILMATVHRGRLLAGPPQAAREGGLPADDILRVAQWSVIAGLIGARLYEVVFNWGYYGRYPAKIPAVWEGGLAMHGGHHRRRLTGVDLATEWRVPIRRASTSWRPSIASSGQAIGRWGNFFNEEAFGRPDRPAVEALHRPPTGRRSTPRSRVLPPHLPYESLCDLAVFLPLVRLAPAAHRDHPGALFLWYVGLYSVGRFAIESLRLDSFWVAGFRVAQLASLAGIAVAIIGLAWTRRRALGVTTADATASSPRR